jgi:hypothetical protein
MDFLSKLLQGIAFVPAVVNGIEGLFGNRSGAEKQGRGNVICTSRSVHDGRDFEPTDCR